MINIKNLHCRYGSFIVFDNFSCSFFENETNYIIGESSSGKTTLLRVIANLIEYDGEIENTQGKKISIVFQEVRLFDEFTILENLVAVLGKTKEKQIEEALKELNLFDFRNMKINKCSGGMKQRVSIIRGVLADFDILLLDEVYKELDEENIQRVQQFIDRLTEGKTVILATNDKRDIRLNKNNIVEIKKGENYEQKARM